MVDTATPRNRFRKQEVGTNVNTWGTNLNEALDAIDQCLDGVEAINLGAAATYTLTTTNYTTADEAKQRVLVLSNANASGTDLVIPSVEHVYGIYNGGGADVEARTSAGTGPTIPTGYFCWVYCDGSNVYSRALFVNGQIRATAATANSELTTLLQVSNLIAAASIAGTGNTFKVSADDTTSKYLEAALTAGTGISLTVNNPAGNENLEVDVLLTSSYASLTTTQLAGLRTLEIGASGGKVTAAAAGYVGGFLDGGVKTSQFTPVVGSAYDVDCSSAGVTVALSSMTTPQVGQEIKLNNFGNFPMFLLGTVNGQTNLSVATPSNGPLRYCGTSWGWN